jgi:TP901 family phage tail tape measure protein
LNTGGESVARSVSVYLQANVAGFVAGMRTAAGAVSTLETKIDTATGKQKKAFDNLGRVGTVAAVGLVGAFALATKATADFDKQMSEVKAATNGSAAEMSKLRKEALQAGRDTAYSATQAAQGQTELAKAGVSTANILGGGLKGALDLAAAGQVSVGEAAEVAATAMTQFGLSGAAVPHIADLLSAGANKAQGSVHDLAFALKQSGLVASQFGLSVDDTVGTLASFASAGLIGQDAGTSFKQMLLQLAKPSNQASDLMHQLGIETYNAGGKFVGVTGLAQQLHDKLSGLTAAQRQNALATIFGTDAIRAASVLYKQGGAGIQDWINKTNDSGNAARTASTKLDNLAGDLTKLKGSIQTALIEAGSGGTGALRDMTQAVTGTVNAFLSLPSGVQGSLVWLAGISGAAILGAKGLIFMVGTVKDARVALEALGLTEARTAALTGTLRTALGATSSFLAGPWGIALATAVGVLAVFAATKHEAAKATQSLTDAVQQDSGAIGEHTRAVVANELEQAGLLKTAQSLGLGLSTVTDAVLGNKAAMDQVRSAIDAYIARLQAKKTFDKDDAVQQENAIAAALNLKKSLDDKNGSLNASVAAAKRQAAATQASSTAQQQAAATAKVQTSAETALSQALTGAAKTADDLKAALDALSKANIDADEAAIAQRKSVTDAGKASDHHRGLVDKERSALIDLAKANQKLLVSMKDDGATSTELTNKQRKLHDQFVKIATAMGISRAEAEKLATRYAILAPKVADASSSIGGFISKAQGAAATARALELRTGGAASAQQVYTGKVRDSLPVLYALAGRNQEARGKVDALARSAGIVAGKMDISHAAFLRSAAAMGIAAGKAEELWKKLQAIKNRDVTIDVHANGLWTTAHDPGRRFPGLAAGGAVPKMWDGATEAYDSQPALLRVGEHVWTNEEVDAAGGHGAMHRMRRLAKAGKLKGYASGGAVLTGTGSVDQVIHPITSGIADMLNHIADVMGAAWKKFAGDGGPIVAAARSQIGVPYCLPLRTKVLSRRGWLSHDDVRVGDETIGYNPETGASEWTMIRQVVQFDDADLVRIGGDRWSVECTPEHRWLSRSSKLPIPKMRRTEELGQSHHLVLAVPADTGDGLPITDREARILGWLSSDGNVRERPGNGVEALIWQSKPHRITELRELLDGIATERIAEAADHRQDRSTFHVPAKYVRDLMARSGHPHRDAPAIVLAMSASQRTAWLDSVIAADGTQVTRNHTVIYACDGPVREAITLAVYLSGHRPSESKLSGKDQWAPCFANGVCSPEYRPLRRGSRIDAGRADVWCVVTDLGSWTAEQDGQVFLTGNSWGGGGPGGPSTGIGRGAGTVGFDCSGLTEYAWWKGRGVDIGGSTGPQAANSTSIGSPRPGALGFVGSPIHHVMLASNKPGYVIQAPHTGAFVEEVPRSSSNWRWPKFGAGGAVGEVMTLGDAFTRGRVSLDQAKITQLLQIAGGAPRREDHSPQIVNPGDIRVFGEPESGGEAYIPLAQSKRARSTQLLAQVARAFGLGVTGLANGGVIGLADGGTTDLPLSEILGTYNDVVNPASKADVTAAAKARTKQVDQLKNAEDALAKARHKHHKDWAQIRKDERRVAQERRDVADATNHLRDVENRYRAGQQSPAARLGSALGLNIKNTGAFIANLTKLADRGFGVLAQQLLAMGGADAEKIAADAVKMSDSKLRTIQGQITTAQKQQATLTNLPNILAVRSALKGGKGGSWAALLDATGLDPGSLATAVHLMAGDLGKTSSGRSLLADMKKHGYRRGGWVGGPAGIDRTPIWATRDEFVVNATQASRHGDLLEAINSGRLSGGRRRFVSGGWVGGAPARGGDGAAAPNVTQVFYHQAMSASQLAREAAREAAWALT